MPVKWQRHFSAAFETEVFPSGDNPFAQNRSTKKKIVFCESLCSMNVLKAGVEDVKMEGVGLKTDKYIVDASQDQMRHDIVPKLFSNAACDYPAAPGYSIIRYLRNLLAEIFFSMMDSGKEESLNSHWAVLSLFGLCMKINAFLLPPPLWSSCSEC